MPRSLLDALKPDAIDKKDGSVNQARSDRAQKEKKIKEGKAKERKRVREQEKERVSEVNATIEKQKEETKKAKVAASKSDRERLIEVYLEKPPFYGVSDIADKDKVRALCAGPDNRSGDRHFDWDKKMWGTRKIQNLPALLDDDGYGDAIWWPHGIEKDWEDDFRRILAQKINALSETAEAKSQAMREESMQGREPVMNAEQKKAFDLERDRDAGIQSATQAERDKMIEYGITEEVLRNSKTWACLGPTVGMSLEGRINRFIHIFKDAVRDHLQGPNFFDETMYEPAQDRAVKILVKEWLESSRWSYRWSNFEELYMARVCVS